MRKQNITYQAYIDHRKNTDCCNKTNIASIVRTDVSIVIFAIIFIIESRSLDQSDSVSLIASAVY